MASQVSTAAVCCTKNKAQVHDSNSDLDLLSIFKNPRQQNLVLALRDAGYLGIYQTLFRAASDEKRGYLSGKTDAARTKAERALALISDCLRVAIRAGHEKVKPKTLKTVLHLAVDFLNIGRGDYNLPFSQTFVKVLNTILEHEAHVELLDEEDWLATVDFCLAGIEHQDAESLPISLSRQNSLMPGSSSTPRRPIPAGRAASNVAMLAGIKKRNAEELMECLRSLVSATNAPVLLRTKDILDAIVHFLQCQSPVVGHFHQVAFNALNTMLLATSADDVGAAAEVVTKVLPLIAQLWGSKTAANDEMLNLSKDEMAITILLLRLHIKRLLAGATNIDLEGTLRDVQQSLRNDYDKRNERDQLQFDDLYMALDRDDESWSELLPCGYLYLQPHNIRSERRWITLQALAALDGLLYHDSSRVVETQPEDEHNESRHPRKRRRVAKRFDALLDDIRLDVNGGRLSALQILMFALPESSFDQDSVEDLFTQLTPYVVDRSSEISSWAMLCCAG